MEGPRIYNLFPLAVGTVPEWKRELPRIAGMGFNWVYLNPFHMPGFSGSLYAVKDHYTLNPLFRGKARQSDDALLRTFVQAAEAQGLRVMMDLVVNHTSKDAMLASQHPDWYVHEEQGELRSPRAVDPDDPEKVTVWGDLAELDYTPRPARDAMVAYWADLVRHYVGLGFEGFRCDAAYQVPGEVWRSIIAAARETSPESLFFAETLGCRPEEVAQLAPAGFDFIFNSAKWWDFRAPWLLDLYETYRQIAPSIAFPESHDTERLAADLRASGLTEPGDIARVYCQRYLFAALFSSGVMMPFGYEFGWSRKLDVVTTRPEHREPSLFDISDFVGEVNRLKARYPLLNEEGPQRRLDHAGEAVALLREAHDGHSWVLTLINPDPHRNAHLDPEAAPELARLMEAGTDITPGASAGEGLDLTPFGIRVILGGPGAAIVTAGATVPERPIPRTGPIVIQNVYPEVDCGRYPVKREVGDELEIWADIFREGHDKVTAVLRYRRCGGAWTEMPMDLREPGLDRWSGRLPCEANARYEYTIVAWPDLFESWRAEVEKKLAARQDVALELIEGRALVADAATRAGGQDGVLLERVLTDFDTVSGSKIRAEILFSGGLREVMARNPDRDSAVTYPHTMPLTVDRERARFAAWYEMFARSQGSQPGRSATFRDCEARLPEIAGMGFDVVYLPPIHPIGRTNRKGKNNTPGAGPDDPGSPYAIGAKGGGHTAVHPDLGTLEEFHAFVRAAESHGMEVALDFAIQCSPDHPWIREHPEWFVFRPDGTIKHAENPPKKYQDIVNVNFYGPHQDALWRELRDVLLFWVGNGVRTFRVDNPHTKPIPFWEWVINEVQARHPDVIFLSEAFTRPRVLEMLAKVGFSQSYTYFTWRNFKDELITYMTELTQTPVKEYLRPNFFTNTPDILPPFLQTGGPPAFRIRFVLAATLSSVYGIYNGFELCEAAAIPGTEEYLNSEKYEHRVWDWNRLGNIKNYIARINAIRRENPALQEFENLRFYDVADPNVLFYSKIAPDRSNIVFVIVVLDPFDAHDVEITLPLDKMGIAEDAPFEAEELITGARHLWRGPHQIIHLDPSLEPAAILRVVPWTSVDYREPCF